MNETREYLDHHSRVTADSIVGTIIEEMNDGTYKYKEIASGAIRYAAPNSADRYRPNERVTIGRPSASGNVMGSMDTIIGRAPREQRGLSATTPAEDRDSVDRAVIITVDPDPLVLELGGDAGEQTFTGHGFDSQPASYVPSVGEDPVLTNASAPVASDTEVTMNISADAGGNLGTFDAVINGARARGALRVIRQPVRPYLWASTRSGSHPMLFQIDPTDLSIVHTYLGPGLSPVLRGGAIVGYGGMIYWLMRQLTSSSAYIAKIDPRKQSIVSSGALPFTILDGTQMSLDAEDGYADAPPHLLINALGPFPSRYGVVATKLDGSGDVLVWAPADVGALQGFTADWPGRIAGVSLSRSKSVLKPAYGGTTEADVTTLKAKKIIAHRAWTEAGLLGAANGLFVAAADVAGTWYRGTLADLVITATTLMTGETEKFNVLLQHRTLIFTITSTGDIYTYDPLASSGATVATGIGSVPNVHLASDGTDLFVGIGNPSVIRRISSVNGATLDTGATLTGSSAGAAAMLYY